MKDQLLSKLLSKVKPRIELDWNKINHRFIPKKDNTSKHGLSKLSAEAEVFLKDILEESDVPITTRGGRLGYTSHMTNKVKNELIRRGLVTEYQVSLGRINKFLEITPAGYTYLKVQAPKHKGKGSPEHRYWQRRILHHYQNNLGLKAKIEGQRGEKLVDVAVMEEDGTLLAVEIALTAKNELRNIKEDLAVGFHKVLIACKNKRVREEVEKKVAESLNDEDKRKVAICLLTDFL